MEKEKNMKVRRSPLNVLVVIIQFIFNVIFVLEVSVIPLLLATYAVIKMIEMSDCATKYIEMLTYKNVLLVYIVFICMVLFVLYFIQLVRIFSPQYIIDPKEVKGIEPKAELPSGLQECMGLNDYKNVILPCFEKLIYDTETYVQNDSEDINRAIERHKGVVELSMKNGENLKYYFLGIKEYFKWFLPLLKKTMLSFVLSVAIAVVLALIYFVMDVTGFDKVIGSFGNGEIVSVIAIAAVFGTPVVIALVEIVKVTRNLMKPVVAGITSSAVVSGAKELASCNEKAKKLQPFLDKAAESYLVLKYYISKSGLGLLEQELVSWESWLKFYKNGKAFPGGRSAQKEYDIMKAAFAGANTAEVVQTRMQYSQMLQNERERRIQERERLLAEARRLQREYNALVVDMYKEWIDEDQNRKQKMENQRKQEAIQAELQKYKDLDLE